MSRVDEIENNENIENIEPHWQRVSQLEIFANANSTHYQ